MAASDDAGGAVPDSAPTPPTAVEGQDYSGTNVQEVGVDEGDIVETDGDFVYVASRTVYESCRSPTPTSSPSLNSRRAPISCCSMATAWSW